MPILALAPHPFAKINKFIFQLFKQLFRNRNLVMFFISIKRIAGNNTIVNICKIGNINIIIKKYTLNNKVDL